MANPLPSTSSALPLRLGPTPQLGRPADLKKPCPKCGKLVVGLKTHVAAKHPKMMKPKAPAAVASLVDLSVGQSQVDIKQSALSSSSDIEFPVVLTTSATSSSAPNPITSAKSKAKMTQKIHSNPNNSGSLFKPSVSNVMDSSNLTDKKIEGTVSGQILVEEPRQNQQDKKQAGRGPSPLKPEPPHIYPQCVTCENSVGKAWVFHWLSAHPAQPLPYKKALVHTEVRCPFLGCGRSVTLLGLHAHWRAKHDEKALKSKPPASSASAKPTPTGITATFAASPSVPASLTAAINASLSAITTTTATTVTAANITTNATPASNTTTTLPATKTVPIVDPEAVAILNKIRSQLATYKAAPSYTLLTVPSAKENADTLIKILNECVVPHAQSVYRNQIHSELRRLADRYYTEALWDDCRDCMRELLTKAITISHNSDTQKSALRTRLTKCNTSFASQVQENITRQHAKTEKILKFWGVHVFEVFPEQIKYENLSNEIIDMVKKRTPTPAYRAQQAQALKEMDAIVKSLHSNAHLEVFGSAATGLDQIGSDLDCGVVGFQDTHSFENFLLKLIKHLRNYKEYGKIVPILHARIPLLKCKNLRANVDMDISQMRDEQRFKTQLFQKYCKLDDRFVMLTHVVKKFAQVNGLGDASAGGLNSFGWTLLVLQFCQMTSPPVLPNIQDLRTSWDGWVSANKDNVGFLLVQFFIFYTRKFHPFRDCVSVRVGAFSSAPSRRGSNNVRGTGASSLTTTPAASIAVVVTISSPEPASPSTDAGDQKVDLCFQSKQQTFLCVEDPLDPTDNVGRGLVQRKVEDIYSAMCAAREVLRTEQSLTALLRPLPSADTRWNKLTASTKSTTVPKQQTVIIQTQLPQIEKEKEKLQT